MSMIASPWTCFLTGRLLSGVVDVITDVLQAAALLSAGHPIWSSLTIVFPILALLVSMASVVIGSRCGVMPCRKFLALTLRVQVAICEGLFESGPELVLQTVIIVHGVHLEDLQVLFSNEEADRYSLAWFRGLLHLMGLLSSLISIIVTLMYFNEERLCKANDVQRLIYAFTCTVTSVLFRVFIAAILFSVVPVGAATAAAVLAALAASICGATCDHNWDVALASGYASLFAPAGYSKHHGYHHVPTQQKHRTNSLLRRRLEGHTIEAVTLSQSFSEVERAKINQESLLRKVLICHGFFAATSFLLFLFYVTLLEIYLFGSSQGNSKLLPMVNNRVFLYTVPSILMCLSWLFSYLFFVRAEVARDAARWWFHITPHRNRKSGKDTMVMQRRPSYTQQLRDEEAAIASGVHSSEASTAVISDAASFPPAASGDQRPQPSAPSHVSDPPSYPSGIARSALDYYFPDAKVDGEGEVGVSLLARRRLEPGTRRCDSASCVTCEFFIEGPAFTSQMSGKKYRFMPYVTCKAAGVIYLVTCGKCKKQYVGKTEQTLKQRHYGHRREIELQSSPLGRHFAQGCGYPNWRMQIIDQSQSAIELRRREGYWQHELMTFVPWGLNTRDEKSGGIDITVNT